VGWWIGVEGMRVAVCRCAAAEWAPMGFAGRAAVYTHCWSQAAKSSTPNHNRQQIDRLVQLLETPSFTFLRLQLLQPSQHADLLRACYGLLMLLPQSSAFRTLHARLHAAPPHALLQLEQQATKASSRGWGRGSSGDDKRAAGKAAAAASDWAPFEQLLSAFVARQQAHLAAEERRRAVLDGLIVVDDEARGNQQQQQRQQQQQPGFQGAEAARVLRETTEAATGGVGGLGAGGVGLGFGSDVSSLSAAAASSNQ